MIIMIEQNTLISTTTSVLLDEDELSLAGGAAVNFFVEDGLPVFVAVGLAVDVPLGGRVLGVDSVVSILGV